MKIGLISDTHTPGDGQGVPESVHKVFDGVDLILHAGNIFVSSILDELETIAPVKAAGSKDRDKLCLDGSHSWKPAGCWCADDRVEEIQVIEAEGLTIGLIHELVVPGYSDRIYPGSLTRGFHYDESQPLIPDETFGKRVDIIVFGHTCTALHEEYGSTVLINPGRPYLRNELRRVGTVATLEIVDQKQTVEIIDLAAL